MLLCPKNYKKYFDKQKNHELKKLLVKLFYRDTYNYFIDLHQLHIFKKLNL